MTSSKIQRKYERILVRADGSPSIGMGHVVRSMVLARELLDLGAHVEAWGSGVELVKSLATSFEPIPVRNYSTPGGKLDELANLRLFKPDLVIADGYHFTEEFFGALQIAGIDYGVIDDNGETPAVEPVFVANQSPAAPREFYEERFPNAFLYLGLANVLLRREVWDARLHVDEAPSTVLISMGGSDPRGLTELVVEVAAREFDSLAVAVPPAARKHGEVSAKLQEIPRLRLLESQALVEEMTSSSLVILAAGTTLWEAVALGKRIIAIVVADNQLTQTVAAADQGLIQGFCDARGGLDSSSLGALIRSSLDVQAGSPLGKSSVGDGAQHIAKWLLGI